MHTPTLLLATATVVATLASGRTSTSQDVPWLNEIRSPPDQLPKDLVTLSNLLVTRGGQSIRSMEQWSKPRAELRQSWLEFLQPLPIDQRESPELTVLEEDKIDNVVRQRVRYAVEPGILTEGYLLRPATNIESSNSKETLRPGVVVFHSTVNHSIRQPAGLEGKPEKFFALNLAKRGYITFCPRNFLWPTNDSISARRESERFQRRRPGHTGMAKMLHDAMVAVDILAAQPGVDGNRLGSVGHSLGAKEVLYLAAFDERVKVSVSSEGGIGTRFSNWHDSWYLGDAIQQPGFAREHHELLALVAPRPFLLIGGDSADGDRSWPYIEAALSVYRLYDSSPPIGLFNHKQGHAVPPNAEQRIYEWFEGYLPTH